MFPSRIAVVLLCFVQVAFLQLIIYTDPTSTCSTIPCGDITCPCTTLESAITNATTSSSSNPTLNITISCAPGVYQGAGNSNITISSAGFTLISQQGAANTTIQLPDYSYLFSIQGNASNPIELNGFTITNDQYGPHGQLILGENAVIVCNELDFMQLDAQSIFRMFSSSLELNGCQLNYNNVTENMITSIASSLEVNNCKFSLNNMSGIILNAADSGSLYVYNSEFSNNTLGAIILVGKNNSVSQTIASNIIATEIHSSNFTDNISGFIVSVYWGALNMTQNQFISNSAKTGIITTQISSVTITNTSFTHNSPSAVGIVRLQGYTLSDFIYAVSFNLAVSLNNILFERNVIQNGIALNIIDVNTTMNHISFIRNTQTNNVLSSKLSLFNYQQTTTLLSFNAALVFTDILFSGNINTAATGGTSNIAVIQMVDSLLHSENITFIENISSSFVVEVIFLTTSDSDFILLETWTLLNNSYGMYLAGNINLNYSVIEKTKFTAMEINSGIYQFDNILFVDNGDSSTPNSINIDNQSDVTLKNCTITNNRASTGIIDVRVSTIIVINSTFTDNISTFVGGCINAYSRSIVTISQDCHFSNNSAVIGGAIALTENSSLTVKNATFLTNNAIIGGAIYCDSSSDYLIQYVEFRGNYVTQAGGAINTKSKQNGVIKASKFILNVSRNQGGAISFSNNTQSSVIDCEFKDNLASSGGAIECVEQAAPTISKSTFYNNRARNDGGSLYIRATASPYFEDCLFLNNTSDSVGGAASIIDFSRPRFFNCTFEENNTPNEAGAFHCTDQSHTTIQNSVLHANRAGSSGGAFTFGVNATAEISHTQIVNNTADSKGGGIVCYNNCYPQFINVTIAYNVATSGAALWITDTANPLVVDSLFERNEAKSQGGALLASDYASGNITKTLFRDNTATSGAGGAVSLEDFSTAAFYECVFEGNMAQNGGAIFTAADNGPKVKKSMFVNNIAQINGGAFNMAENCSAVIEDIVCLYNHAFGSGGCIFIGDISYPTFTGLNATGNNATTFGGGAFIADKSSPIFTNSQFTLNYASNGGGIMSEQTSGGSLQNVLFYNNTAILFGGGMLFQSSNLTMSQLSVLHNRATSGGGIAITGAGILIFNETVCTDCEFYGNAAVHGGGIFIELSGKSGFTNSTVAPGDLVVNNYTFRNATISHNVAEYGAGIYYLGNFFVSFIYPTFTSNFAIRYGGAIYIQLSSESQIVSWIVDAVFDSNEALFGGYNVGLPDQQFSEDFCVNCVWGTNKNTSMGYNNAQGFASAPTSIDFLDHCPGSVTLTYEMFNISVQLYDAFHTEVTGSVLMINQYTVNVENDATCNLTVPGSRSVRMSEAGISNFYNMFLQGKDNSQCGVRYTLTSIPKTSMPQLNCFVSLNGCPTGYQLINSTPYDYCQIIPPPSHPRLTTTNLLILIICCLVFTIIIILVILSLAYALYLRKKRQEYTLATTEIPDFLDGKPNFTLQDILNDPQIPHISWEQIVNGPRIGMGASGAVYQAQWFQPNLETPSEIALKELLFGMTDLNSESLREFLLEIKLMSALKNDNIVEFLGITCPSQDKLYLITELMHQGNLRDVLDRKGQNLPWKLRLKLAKDAAKGMAYLHARKIIHRDLKPQNLLVNKSWNCKIADFGISTVSHHTKHMTCVGTPIYMAPEVLSKDKYSEKADVYSFGVLLVEIYTGLMPYSNSNLNQAQLMYQIVNNGIRPDVSELPTALEQLVVDCWAEDPRLRPSFTEIIVRLRRLSHLQKESDLPSTPNGGDSGMPSSSIQRINEYIPVDTSHSINSRSVEDRIELDNSFTYRGLTLTRSPQIDLDQDL